MENIITRRALLLGLLMAAFFAFLTVYFENRHDLYVTAIQIPVLPYILLFLTVLLINPLCALVRFIRPFSVAEILMVFCMGMVSSGVSTFGLSSQLVPIAGNLFNKDWNTEQAGWDRYVVPYLNEQFFLSEQGVQERARQYQAVLEQGRNLQRQLDAAEEVQKAGVRVTEAEEALRAVRESREGTPAQRAMYASGAEQVLRVEREALVESQQAWSRMETEVHVSWQEVLRAWPPRVAAVDSERNARKAVLQQAMSNAFVRVEVFRAGLPKEMRAFPGIFPSSDDNFATYAGRVRRLWYGKQALSQLGQTEAALAALPAASPVPAAAAGPLAERMGNAVRVLGNIERQSGSLKALLAVVEEELNQIQGQLQARQIQITALSAEGREATPDRRRKIEDQKSKINNACNDLKRDQEKLKSKRDVVLIEAGMVEGVTKIAGEIGVLQAALTASPGLAAGEGRRQIQDAMRRLSSLDTTLRAFLVGYVPWNAWLRPLAFWGILIALTYMVLMAFNVLIFRQWAYNEKLIYPLAELPEYLVGKEEGNRGGVPAIFKSGYFWIGVTISGTVLSWNLFVASNVVPGLKPLALENSWRDYIANTSLQGLMPGARSLIFFTMIGFAFLIPQKVSFSLWFFSVVYMAQLLIMVWLGYGDNEKSFMPEWWYTLNFRTAEGGGALMIFASVVLFRCRRYIFSAFLPRTVSQLEPDERRELRICSFLFLLGSLGVVLMLWRGLGANLYYTIFAYLVIIMITIGLVRAVAEGGIIGFQAWVGPFHFIRTFFGMDKAWTAPSLFAPLMVYYSIFFLDIKAFIAPAMANALKIRDDLRIKRGQFHLALALALVVSAVVGLAVTLMFTYSIGGNMMNGWFHTGLPKSLYEQIATMSKQPPAAAPTQTAWVIVGAGAMAALLYFRQFLFWLPHPIGLIMLVNPIMIAYWFSILIGWAAKTLVTRYGNQDAYRKARFLFIGLIFGELLLFAVNLFLSYGIGLKRVISVNYNWI